MTTDDGAESVKNRFSHDLSEKLFTPHGLNNLWGENFVHIQFVSWISYRRHLFPPMSKARLWLSDADQLIVGYHGGRELSYSAKSWEKQPWQPPYKCEHLTPILAKKKSFTLSGSTAAYPLVVLHPKSYFVQKPVTYMWAHVSITIRKNDSCSRWESLGVLWYETVWE